MIFSQGRVSLYRLYTFNILSVMSRLYRPNLTTGMRGYVTLCGWVWSGSHQEMKMIPVWGNQGLMCVQGSVRARTVCWFCNKRKYNQKSVLMLLFFVKTSLKFLCYLSCSSCFHFLAGIRVSGISIWFQIMVHLEKYHISAKGIDILRWCKISTSNQISQLTASGLVPLWHLRRHSVLRLYLSRKVKWISNNNWG